MRTYLLPETPTAVTLDPADRAFHVAYSDGSLQTIDFFDEIQKTVPTDVLRDPSSSHRPIQPSPKTRFNAESQKLGGALSLSLSWDGTTLISGHASGKVAVWDIAKGNYLSTSANIPGPVSNLCFLSPTGFPQPREPSFKIQTVVKPKQDSGSTGSGNSMIPSHYTLNMQFTGRLRPAHISATDELLLATSTFQNALTHPSFPTSMLEESLAELNAWSSPAKSGLAPAAEFLALGHNDDVGVSGNEVQRLEMTAMKKQLASLQRVQKVTFSQLSKLREENEYLVDQEKKRAEQARTRAKKRHGFTNGSAPAHNDDVEMNDGADSSVSESDTGDVGAIEA
jgi:pre-rRNA-processing protein IPI3